MCQFLLAIVAVSAIKAFIKGKKKPDILRY
jgi:hypothetical protein